MNELRIESLAFGGSGVGRLGGKVVFVPLTAPGDLVRFRPLREKKHFTEGEVQELVQPSPLRRVPPCPVFGRCGGCQWQHLPYAEQARWKERIFAETLQRQAEVPAAAVLPIVPAPEEWHYRSRVQFKCRLTEQGLVIGFYRRGSHFVIDVEQCPITDRRLNQTLGVLRRLLARAAVAARIPQIDLAVGDDGRQRAIIHYLGSAAEELIEPLRPLSEECPSLALFVQMGRKESLRQLSGDAADLRIRVGDPPLELAYGPGGFAQINLEQNRALVRQVVEAARLTGKERILDLFCGMGNFSLPLARGAREVLGVEDYAPAIAKARENARRYRLDNAFFEARPAEEALADLRGEAFDLVLLDPPRTGAYPVAKGLAELGPRRILYVS